MPRRHLLVATLVAAVILAPIPRPIAAKGADSLLVGVQRIAAPGVPGPLLLVYPACDDERQGA
jgi:hypothetical protein